MINSDAKVVVAALNKKMGPGTVVLGSDVQPVDRVPSGSVTLDFILGGGWPANQWHMLVGEFSSGKTCIALKTIAENQQRDPEWTAVWVAAETWAAKYAEMCGVDNSRVIVIETNVMEDAYDAVIQFAESKSVDCIVIDSLPALIPSAEDDKAMDELTIGRGAMLTNKFFRKVGKAMKRSLTEAERPVMGIMINQYRMQIGVMHGDPRTIPGGKGLSYAMFCICEVRRDEWIEEGTGEAKQRVGQRTRVRTMKNKSAPPQRTAFFDFYFADGACPAGEYDFAKEILSMALVFNIIERKGAWYYYQDRKWQGTAPLLAEIREDIDLKEALQDLVLAPR